MANAILALPGSSVLAISSATGRAKLDPRFLSVLVQAKVPEAVCDALGNAECDSAALFGSLCPDEKGMDEYFKRVLNVDPAARDADFIIRARLNMVWEACKVRAGVETKAAAERAVAQLPPQITIGDYEAARTAYEATLGYELADHHCPSQPLLEKLVAQVETTFKPIKLSAVTSFAQQVALMPDNPGMHWDERARTFQNRAKEFTVPMPQNAEELETSFRVLGHAYAMTKMRFGLNPKLATFETGILSRYLDFLKGPQVWGFVVKGSDGMPISSPHIGIVTDFDLVLRTKQVKHMNGNIDFQKALEMTLADGDLRLLNFTSVFTCQVTSDACTALTAPGLSQQFPGLQRGTKRAAPATPTNQGTGSGAGAGTPLTKSAKKRAAKAKAKANAQQQQQAGTFQQRQVGQQQQTRAQRQQQQKGLGKGGKGGKPNQQQQVANPAPTGGGGRTELPAGAKDRTDDGRPICHAYNTGTCTRGANCRFAHVSWFPPHGAAAATRPPPAPGAGGAPA